MSFQILEWDSAFLGITVARIIDSDLDEDELTGTLVQLKKSCVSLVYWPSHRRYDDLFMAQRSARLVDTKLVFAIDLRTVKASNFISTDIVEAYSQSMPIADIENLAVQSGEYSRFATDPNIPRDKFLALYKTWINRSLTKEIASEVLVIRENKAIVGLVTLGTKGGRGDIGLIAVDRRHRGKRYGERLVRAAQKWFVGEGFQWAQVVTQGRNTPACNLYKKCGYSIEKVEYYYHFWL